MLKKWCFRAEAVQVEWRTWTFEEWSDVNKPLQVGDLQQLGRLVIAMIC